MTELAWKRSIERDVRALKDLDPWEGLPAASGYRVGSIVVKEGREPSTPAL
jgi:hypothetical protein